LKEHPEREAFYMPHISMKPVFTGEEKMIITKKRPFRSWP